MNRIYSFILSLLLAAVLGEGGSSRDMVRTFNSAPGKTLTIDLETGGDILVTGGSGSAVKVTVRFSGEDSDDLDVDVRETASGVEISSEYDGPRRNYRAEADVEVEVPSRYNVSLETMGGDVTIRNVEGSFSGKSMGGDLNLNKLAGEVDLTTMGGEVQVVDSNLDGEVETMGGDVVLRNVSGDVRGSTMGGDVVHEGTPAGPGTQKGEKRVHSMGGDLTLDSAPEGASMETMGGDIHIRSASDHVQAKTMGGDIQVDAVDGWAKLTTMGGDVTVRMTGDPKQGKRDVELTSMGGDVELTLPDGISATFDLETEYSQTWSQRPPRILSDFPVQVDESDDCRYEHHRSCVSLRGTGSVGDGKHRVKIRTVGGDIIIKRG